LSLDILDNAQCSLLINLVEFMIAGKEFKNAQFF